MKTITEEMIKRERLERDMKYEENEFLNAFNAAAEYYARGENWSSQYNLWYKEMLSRERKLGELYNEFSKLSS